MFCFVRVFLFLFFIAMPWAYATTPSISSSDAKIWADEKGKELLFALSEKNKVLKYAKLDKMMNEYVNLDYISSFVIGKYARVMTNTQKKTYSELFKRYALSLYKQLELNIQEADSITFSIEDIIEHPSFTTVTCFVDITKLISAENETKIPAKFKLIRGSKNNIQAVDVEIANVSMVIEYRRRFYEILKEEDEEIDWFLDRLENIVEANEQRANKSLSSN